MNSFDDYAQNALTGIKEGAGDMARHAIADIGDSYQEVLMSNASISPPEGLTGSVQQVTLEAEQSLEIASPELDMERG